MSAPPETGSSPARPVGPVGKLIALSARNPWFTIVVVAALAVWGVHAMIFSRIRLR